jgi:predicted GNAT family N-acyltransferase
VASKSRLGATLWNLLSGEFVHEAPTAAELVVRSATQPARSLARVLIARNRRAESIALIRRALQAVAEQWGAQPVRIGAQARLAAFYASHGFVDANRPYVEDGIDHLEMVWHPLKPGAIG